jgi:VWFA-related protein
MSTRARPAAVAIAAVVCAIAPLAAQQAARPVFRSGVDLIAVEVQVVDRDGRPIPALSAGDFEVKIDGRTRTVVSADLITYEAGIIERSTRPGAHAARPEPARRDDRMFILAVDEASFQPGAAMVVRESARRFLAKLSPSDRVGVFKFPIFERMLDITRDHAAAARVFDRVVGTFEPFRSSFDLLPSEAVDISGGDRETLDQVVRRECVGQAGGCRDAIVNEARIAGAYAESDAANRVLGLRLLLDALAEVPGRKMLVVMSGGMLSADRTTGRPDIGSIMLALGKQAAVANASLYVMHLDDSFFDGLFRRGGRPPAPGDPPPIARLGRDGNLFALGLEQLAGAAGGEYMRVRAGTPDYVFERVLRETSAYYLLAVEPEPRIRDGRLHFLRVGVTNVKGATVRSKSHVFIPRPPPDRRSPDPYVDPGRKGR